MTLNEARQIAARGYCHPANAHKILDPDLCDAIADEMVKAVGAPVITFREPAPPLRPEEIERMRDEVARSYQSGTVLTITDPRIRVEFPVPCATDDEIAAFRRWQADQRAKAGPDAEALDGLETPADWNNPPGDIKADLRAVALAAQGVGIRVDTVAPTGHTPAAPPGTVHPLLAAIEKEVIEILAREQADVPVEARARD